MTRVACVVLLCLAGAVAPHRARAQITDAAPIDGIQLREGAPIRIQELSLKVTVDVVEWSYQLVSTAAAPVIAELAVPLPPRQWDPAYYTHEHDYRVRVWVADRELLVYPHHLAMAGGKDVTGAVREAGLTPEALGGVIGAVRADGTSDDQPELGEVASLPSEKVTSLVKLGALCSDPGSARPRPCWSVLTTYRWSQQVLPGRPVHVRLRYTPLRGYEHGSYGSTFRSSCADPSTAKAVLDAAKRDAGDAVWHELRFDAVKGRQATIPEFELMVERPARTLTSFCWPGPVQKVGKNTFRVTAKNYVPPDELVVAFFGPWDELKGTASQ